jgi:hypothetical protein
MELTRALSINPRTVDELPWQLAEGKAWERLYHLLSDLPFFMALWDANKYELKWYWSKVEGGSAYRMVDAYRCVLKEPEKYNIGDIYLTGLTPIYCGFLFLDL